MLSRIIDLIDNSSVRIENGTLFCNSYSITDKDVIDYLEENNILENFINDYQIGNTINLELSLARLNSVGFYEDRKAFIRKNKYQKPSDLYYIHELKCKCTDSNDFISAYNHLISFIDSIKLIAKHTYTDVDIDKLIIFREDKSLFLSLIYNCNNVESLLGNIDKIDYLTQVFKGSNSEKKLLYINELIVYLGSYYEDDRFKSLLSLISDFHDKCKYAYQFYLRDYSYNKLKIELDSKALEFTQKIQSIINDSQTKLIAIPTAFLLAFTTFDFKDLMTIKDLSTIVSLFIFSVLIQLFLNNQKSALRFIAENISSYKETFRNHDIDKISSRFALVEKEEQKQKKRILIVEIILWLIPISLLLSWLFLINLQIWKIVVLLFIVFIIIYRFLIHS